MRGRGSTTKGRTHMHRPATRAGIRLSLAGLVVFLLACGGGGGGGGGTGIKLNVVAPAADLSVLPGTLVRIRYVDDDLDAPDDVTTSVYAIPVTAPDSGIRLSDSRPQGSGSIQTVLWNTTGVPAGRYRIEARALDRKDLVLDEAPGVVEISSTPLVVESPAADATVSRGGFLAIDYRATYLATTATVSMFADLDGDPTTSGDRYPISTDVPDQNGTTERVIWDATGVPIGNYRLFATVKVPGQDDLIVELPSRVFLQNVAGAGKASTLGTDQGIDAGAFPDGTSVLVGGWNGIPPVSHAFAARFSASASLAGVKNMENDTSSTMTRVETWTDGSFLVTGSLSSGGTLGKNEPNQTTLSAGSFLARYNADGTLAWAKATPIPAGATLSDYATLAGGGFVVTGNYTGSVVFNTLSTAVNFTSAGGADVFLAGFDSLGRLIWVRTAGGPGNDAAWRVETLADGSSVVLGGFAGAATFGGGETNQTTLNTARTQDTWVGRFASGGNLAFAAGGLVPPPGNPVNLFLGLFPDGSFALVGPLTGAQNFAIGTAEETTLSTPGQTMFVARFSSNATMQFAKMATDGAGTTNATDVAAFANGSVVIVGDVTAGTLFGPGERPGMTMAAGAFYARYLSSGTLTWLKQAEVRGNSPLTVAGFPDGSFAVGGDLNQPVTFGEGSSHQRILAPGSGQPLDFEAFLARYNADGEF